MFFCFLLLLSSFFILGSVKTHTFNNFLSFSLSLSLVLSLSLFLSSTHAGIEYLAQKNAKHSWVFSMMQSRAWYRLRSAFTTGALVFLIPLPPPPPLPPRPRSVVLPWI